MKRSTFDVITRTALWRANKKVCFYCNEPILFRDLEIDHLIPASIDQSCLDTLVTARIIDSDFDIGSFRNLVPTHHSCNARKSDKQFSESALHYYFKIWREKQSTVEREIQTLKRQASNEKLLTSLAARIHHGHISLREAVVFLEISSRNNPSSPLEPVVITFGLNIRDTGEEPSPSLYDQLESDLLSAIRSNIPSLSAITEASLRTGETISVRMAFWSADLNKLSDVPMAPWQVLENARYSDIYSGSWEELFPQAVVDTYHSVIRDTSNPIFGLGRCPQCGSKKLAGGNITDYEHDEEYFVIECEHCGWSDWSQ